MLSHVSCVMCQVSCVICYKPCVICHVSCVIHSSQCYTFMMDNVCFHKTLLIREFFNHFEMIHPATQQRIKHQVKYLPPYSPFFNIAEYCFSCWKAHARYFQYNNREELTSFTYHTTASHHPKHFLGGHTHTNTI